MSSAHGYLRRAAIGTVFLACLVLVGGAWSLASHPGSSPDDNFHLTSIWCAWGREATGCEFLANEDFRSPVSVPELQDAVSDCMIFKPEESAACQANDPEGDGYPNGANSGGYPDGYYAVARLLVGSSVEASIVAIRFATFVVSTGLWLLAGLLLRPADRWRTWWHLLALSVPLGLFIFASTNPSSTAIAGAVGVAISSYAIGRATDIRALLLAAAVGLAGAVMATLSRSDGWQFALVALGLGALASLRVLTDAFRWRHLLAWGTVFVALAALVVSDLTPSATVDDEGRPAVSLFGNALELLSLYVGGFPTRLGWLDTPMPALVWGSMALVLGGLLFLGLSDLTLFRGAALALGAVALAAIPLLVLEAAGEVVGAYVQPRYLLPLVMTMGVLLAVRTGGRTPLQWGQLAILTAMIVTAQAVALRTTILRSTTGLDGTGWSLSASAEWWWDAGPSPDAVWMVGSLAFGVLALGAAWQVSRSQLIPEPEDAPASLPREAEVERPA